MDLISILSKAIVKGEDVFIAPNATVIGNVRLGDESSVWYGAVLRGDSDIIQIGSGTNIQDNAVIHCDPGAPTIIGNQCIIGHGAIIHGCELGDHVLVGMNAVVLNNAKIGKFVIIGANALVTANTIIPDYSLVLGSPAKVVKTLDEKQIEAIKENARVYIEKSKDYLKFYNSIK